ncbi:hypothetical protein CYLTODRAFT_485425 [Cylindrobasidium torrendii FP15055 ss-10]|uniref:Uncharacterized protein n=1 Tax=Cylindrobasidium torrendii FP15055 ss-10 TaxID=1314674 RepID=A0A0D7BTS9_9AGAR|nr:hypothetical protein CYLTODRAFT_485425 [Cylindrobasidium torrendii FP15055 ss-10]
MACEPILLPAMDSQSRTLTFAYGKATGSSIAVWITATANPNGEHLKHAAHDKRIPDAAGTKYTNIDEEEHQKIKSGFYMHVMYTPADKDRNNTGDYPMVIHAYARRDHDARGKLRSRIAESPRWIDPEIAASHIRSFHLPSPMANSVVYYSIAIHRVCRPFDPFDIGSANYKDLFDKSHAYKACRPLITAAFRYSRGQKSQTTVASSSSVSVHRKQVQQFDQTRKPRHASQLPATTREHRFSYASTSNVPDSLCSPNPAPCLVFNDPKAWQLDDTNPIDVDEDRAIETMQTNVRQEEEFIWVSDDESEDEVMGHAEDGQSDETEILETGRSIKAKEVIVISDDEEDLARENTSNGARKSHLLKQLETQRDSVGMDLAVLQEKHATLQEKHTALANATRHLAEYEAWAHKLEKLEVCKKEDV